MNTFTKENNLWEAFQLLNGDIYIYRGGFKEEASVKDVFKYDAENRFLRFDNNSLPPVEFSTVRLNRAAIALAWYVDPDSDVIRELKKLLDVAQA
jgi:hypothetical protein